MKQYAVTKTYELTTTIYVEASNAEDAADQAREVDFDRLRRDLLPCGEAEIEAEYGSLNNICEV